MLGGLDNFYTITRVGWALETGRSMTAPSPHPLADKAKYPPNALEADAFEDADMKDLRNHGKEKPPLGYINAPQLHGSSAH